ncbi:MAG: isoamylase early set domain-containing protein [Candidatus Wallbacteria bacterium]|nr:isoamylase early set domain-containing protein [Candidatus Wallbacteria bacterium]
MYLIKKWDICLFFLLAQALLSAEDGPENVEDGVIFRYRDPGVKTVSIAGDFNEWSKDKDLMKFDEKQNCFLIKLSLDEGEYAYKFVLDGNKWIKDPFAKKFADDGFGGQNSIVTVKRPEKKAGISGGTPEAGTGEVGTGEVDSAEPGRAGNARFTYKSNSAKSVAVVGSFNQWNPTRNYLKSDSGNGDWETTLYLPPGEYIYFYVIDGKEWRIDANAAVTKDDGFGGKNSVVVIKGEGGQ